ncbi:MAG: hypothetical protein RIT17_1279, partial [Pseudomonadota bacterium]
MRERHADFTRRQALAGIAGVSALALLPACARTAAAPFSTPIAGLDPDAALDRIAYRMLAHEPGRATGLGVDTGEYAAWRSTFGTAGEDGRSAYASTLKELVTEARAYPRANLTSDQQIGFEVVETAFSRAIEGMAMPYGDVAVGSWRNAPYVVIQNVGGYIDMPRFFGSTQPLRSSEDIGPYMDRLAEVPAILDGELERIRAARGMGVIPPAFLLDKAIKQIEAGIATTSDSYAGPMAAAKLDGAEKAAAQAERLATGGITAALVRQLTELKAQRSMAKENAGMWAQPMGEEYYSWAVGASTTTRLTPDEIHR